MFSNYFILSAVLLFSEAQYLGDKCELQNTGYGECVLFSQCQSAIQSIQNGLRPIHCGYQGNEPIVCCPRQEEKENTVLSKSKKECEKYKQNANEFPPLGIVGGAPAEAGEFPHMVALGFGEENDIQWLCGGSLISEKFILTAAHCVASSSAGYVKWARTGTINLKEPDLGGYPQNFQIINRYPHPSYKPPSTYNDIALLEINATIAPSRYVFPACVNSDFSVPTKTQAIGWGRTDYTGGTSNNLLKVNLELYANEICNKSYSNLNTRVLAKGIDDESQICAGGASDESKDTCQGDSGGPLHTLTMQGNFADVYTVVGVTSFGKACGVANIPGIYTRVSHFVPWIEEIVWP